MLLSPRLDTLEEIFIYLERRVNESFSSEISEQYKPSSNLDSFSLPFISCDSSLLESFEVNPDPKIRDQIFLSGGKLRFFFHPEIEEFYAQSGFLGIGNGRGQVNVSPTSSSRTVLTRDLMPNFMIKTDIRKKIGDNIRKIKKEHVDHSLKISRELGDISLPEYMGYLPESIGVVYYRESLETGFIIREIIPRPLSYRTRGIIPFFSLFSRDAFHPEDPLLLDQLIERMCKKKGREFDVFLDKILAPYLNTWAYLVLERGLIPEIHAQNALLELDEEGEATRIICRDLQDFFVDLERRQKKGLNTDFQKNIAGRTNKAYLVEGKPIKDEESRKQISLSFTYDYRIGRALDLFYLAMSRYPSCTKEKFTGAAKEIWRTNFNGTDIFPKRAYFPSKDHPNLEEELYFTEKLPEYR